MVHDVYNQIDEYERLAVDDAIAAVVKTFKEHAIPLGTDDRIERVTEALAVAVSQSRPLVE